MCKDRGSGKEDFGFSLLFPYDLFSKASYINGNFYLIYLFIYYLFSLFRAAPGAHVGSQARGRIGVAVAGLHQSHSNMGSEPHLQPTPQLMATSDS